jgi:hypothetical protein
MTEIERLRAEVEALKIVCKAVFEEAPAQITKTMKKAARDAVKAHGGNLTEDQRAVMGRVVLLTTHTLSADDPRLPKDPQSTPQAATSGESVPAA